MIKKLKFWYIVAVLINFTSYTLYSVFYEFNWHILVSDIVKFILIAYVFYAIFIYKEGFRTLNPVVQSMYEWIQNLKGKPRE